MLADSFATLSQKTPELIDEFSSNCETQRNLVKNGETLLSKPLYLLFLFYLFFYFKNLDSINGFTSALNTFCSKTMEDTLLTVNNYEGARLEYDAYRFDMEILQNSPQTDQKKEQLKNLEQELVVYKEKYEKLKSDVLIKTKFLDENRIKVMKKQLVLFQSATAAYYSNNTAALEDIMKQFNINSSKLSISSSSTDDIAYKSFLEQKI